MWLYVKDTCYGEQSKFTVFPDFVLLQQERDENQHTAIICNILGQGKEEIYCNQINIRTLPAKYATKDLPTRYVVLARVGYYHL